MVRASTASHIATFAADALMLANHIPACILLHTATACVRTTQTHCLISLHHLIGRKVPLCVIAAVSRNFASEPHTRQAEPQSDWPFVHILKAHQHSGKDF